MSDAPLTMHADLERLIALQKIDSAVQVAERTLVGEPERLKALDTRLEQARQQLEGAKARLTENQNARRAVEKDVAVHQGRLSKFRDQAMAVKTNQEYHAIQHEITFAQTEIKTLEDKILELMMEADELTHAVKTAESALAADQKAVEADRRMIATEQAETKGALERLRAERAALVRDIDAPTIAVFDLVSSRRSGVAVAEARDGICTICHVRLRPQVYNTVLRNDQIVQCDSCMRILYHTPSKTPVADQPAS